LEEGTSFADARKLELVGKCPACDGEKIVKNYEDFDGKSGKL
jgi:hypothetical protein